MKYRLVLFAIIISVASILLSKDAKAFQNYAAVSYSACKESEGYKNSFVSFDWLLLEQSGETFKYGIEFQLGGSLENNVNPMLYFAFIPTIQFDFHGIKFEFGTGGMINHNNGNKIGTHSIATKFIIPVEFGKFSLRLGGYILANSPINGLGSIGIAYQL